MLGSRWFYFVKMICLIAFISGCEEEELFQVPDFQPLDSVVSGDKLCTIIEKYYQSEKDLYRFDPAVYLGVIGYVVSSDEGGNFYKTIVVQDRPSEPHCGIQLRLNQSDYYEKYIPGQKIVLKVSGLSIANEKGSLVLGHQRNSRLTEIPESLINEHLQRSNEIVEIQPQKSEIGKLESSMINTYVRLDDVQFVWHEVGRTFAAERFDAYQGVRIIEQCEKGNILPLRTSTYANFSFVEVPASKCSITGVLTMDYYAEELSLVINSIDDLVKIDEERCDPDLYECEVANEHPFRRLFYEHFDDLKSTAQLEDWGWLNQNIHQGQTRFKKRSSSGNTFMQVSCYGSGDLQTECWLVSPEIELPADAMVRVSFKTRATFDDGRQLTVWVTTETTKEITQADWKQLAVSVSDGSKDGSNNEFLSSGTISLSCLEGNARIGFRYVGSDPSATTTYDIDQFLVEISDGSHNQ